MQWGDSGDSSQPTAKTASVYTEPLLRGKCPGPPRNTAGLYFPSACLFLVLLSPCSFTSILLVLQLLYQFPNQQF